MNFEITLTMASRPSVFKVLPESYSDTDELLSAFETWLEENGGWDKVFANEMRISCIDLDEMTPWWRDYNMTLIESISFGKSMGKEAWVNLLKLIYVVAEGDDENKREAVLALHTYENYDQEVAADAYDEDSVTPFKVFEDAEDAGKEWKEHFNNHPGELDQYVDWERVGRDESDHYVFDGVTYFVIDSVAD